MYSIILNKTHGWFGELYIIRDQGLFPKEMGLAQSDQSQQWECAAYFLSQSLKIHLDLPA